MLHKEFFGLIFLGFVFWIIAATMPNQRIENACRPIGWTGSLVTSVSALVLPSQQGAVQGFFDRFEYGCRYAAWRLFYQDAYNQWKATQPMGPADAKASPADAGASAATPAASFGVAASPPASAASAAN